MLMILNTLFANINYPFPIDKYKETIGVKYSVKNT